MFAAAAGSGIPSSELAASRMTACVVVALEAASLSSYLVFVAPYLPDRLPETLVLCIIVLTSYILHYKYATHAHVHSSTWLLRLYTYL